MGLIRDLIGNFAQARAQEAKQKGDEQAQLADIYKFVYQNSPDPQQQQRALQDWMAILGKHGGQQGKEMAEQLTPVLTGQAAVRNAKRMAQDGGMLPNYAGMTQREPAIPMSQTGQFQLPGQQTADWMSTPPASPVDAGQQAATAAAQKVYEQVGVRTASAAGARHGAREGARGFLRTLAHGAEGVGENLMGMPRAQRGAGVDPNIQMPTPEQIQQRQQQNETQERAALRQAGIAAGLSGDALTEWTLTKKLPTGFGAAPKAGATTAVKFTDFKIPTDATGDWQSMAGKTVRLAYDPKTHETFNAAGRQVTLPPGADFAESTTGKITGTLGELAEAERLAREGNPDQQAAAKDWIAKYNRKPVGEQTKEEADEEAKDIAGAIKRGEQDPNLVGLARGGVAGKVRSILAKEGYDLKQAQNDLYIMRHHMAAMNSAQQVRLREATEFSLESLNIVDNPERPGDDLIGKLRAAVPRTRFPILNKAAIVAAKNGAFGQAATDAATLLDGQIADLQSEISVVYMGGNTPTDKGLEQSQRILQSDWDDKTLRDAVGLARKNLGMRINSINHTAPVGLSPTGQEQYVQPNYQLYQPGTAAPPTAAPTATSGTSGGNAPAPGSAEEFLKKHPEWLKK